MKRVSLVDSLPGKDTRSINTTQCVTHADPFAFFVPTAELQTVPGCCHDTRHVHPHSGGVQRSSADPGAPLQSVLAAGWI